MSLMKTALVSLTVGLSLFAAGCIGSPEDGTRRGRTASRARFSLGRKNADMAARNQSGSHLQEVNNLSPDASMSRDLGKLRETEREQERLLSQMRGSLDKSSEQVRREEEKLHDIRSRIQSYDSAIQRYEMASTATPSRDFGAPPLSSASVETASGRRDVSAGYLSRGDELRDYSRDPGQGSYGTAAFEGAGGRPVFSASSFDASYDDTANRLAAYEQSRTTANGEQVIYSGGPSGAVGASYNAAPASSSYSDMPGLPNWDRKVITEPGSVAPAAQNDVAPGKAFGGAPVGRPNRAAKVDNFELPASPFAATSAKKSEIRDYPGMANGLYEPEDAWPDTSRFTQPQPRQAAPAAKPAAASVAPAKTVAAPAEKTPGPKAAVPLNDEVFVPDLYLSGR